MLAIREEGRGEPLVLVHGAGTSSAIWRRTMPSLAARWRVIAPDLPGYGGSPAAGPGFALAQVTDHLVAELGGRRGARSLRPRGPFDGRRHRHPPRRAPSPAGAAAWSSSPRRGWPPCRASPPGCSGQWRRPSRSRGARWPRRSPAARSFAGWRSRASLATARGCPSSTRARCSPARPERRGSVPGWPARRPPTCGSCWRPRGAAGPGLGRARSGDPAAAHRAHPHRAARRRGQRGARHRTRANARTPEASWRGARGRPRAPARTERQQSWRSGRVRCDLQGLLRIAATHGRPARDPRRHRDPPDGRRLAWSSGGASSGDRAVEVRSPGAPALGAARARTPPRPGRALQRARHEAARAPPAGAGPAGDARRHSRRPATAGRRRDGRQRDRLASSPPPPAASTG